MTTAPARPRLLRGFTYIELVVTLALVGLVSLLALPLYELTATRMKEAELRQALRVLRGALDTYKAATDSGSLKREPGESGYPPRLEILTEVLDLASKPDASGSLASQRLVILRQLPRDPFSTDPTLPPEQTWNTRAYASRADDPQPGDDVFDVSSKSAATALDGTPYASW
jgi:general secretion pathway protein G